MRLGCGAEVCAWAKRVGLWGRKVFVLAEAGEKIARADKILIAQGTGVCTAGIEVIKTTGQCRCLSVGIFSPASHKVTGFEHTSMGFSQGYCAHRNPRCHFCEGSIGAPAQ